MIAGWLYVVWLNVQTFGINVATGAIETWYSLTRRQS